MIALWPGTATAVHGAGWVSSIIFLVFARFKSPLAEASFHGFP